jgi:sulfite reductase alpha subunit
MASDTPLLDELEKGPWPSFVKEIKRSAGKSGKAKDLLGVVEQSYKDKVTHWKHGGIVGVTGYGGGVIGRYTDIPEKFPNAEQMHTVRVNHPSAGSIRQRHCGPFATSGKARQRPYQHARFHRDIILLGTDTDQLQPAFNTLTENGFDLGGSGSALRTPSGCVGPARCEWACIDTPNLIYDLTQTFQDELHRPRWPYKFKIKASACPKDCVAAIARADFTIIGTWRDSIRIDQAAVKEYASKGLDIENLIVAKCPGQALEYDAKSQKLSVKPEDCLRCMHCISKMTKAIRPGKETGATILIGGKAPILRGAFLSWVLVPFIKVEPPYTKSKSSSKRSGLVGRARPQPRAYRRKPSAGLA